MCHFCGAIFIFWKFYVILVWHWPVHSCCWMQFWCMVCAKLEPIDRIGLPSRKKPNLSIMNSTKPVQLWINCQTLYDHKSNAVLTKTIAIHLSGRCDFCLLSEEKHSNDFHKFIYFQGVKNYFKFGVGLEIARSLIYNYSLIIQNPLKIFQVLLIRLNWNLVFFLSGYVGIYRVCY